MELPLILCIKSCLYISGPDFESAIQYLKKNILVNSHMKKAGYRLVRFHLNIGSNPSKNAESAVCRFQR